MVKFYCYKVQRYENFTIDDVPEVYRDDVRELLANGGVKQHRKILILLGVINTNISYEEYV